LPPLIGEASGAGQHPQKRKRQRVELVYSTRSPLFLRVDQRYIVVRQDAFQAKLPPG